MRHRQGTRSPSKWWQSLVHGVANFHSLVDCMLAMAL
jgi:hypothetical protein